MGTDKTENLITECKQIQDDSTYTAEAHHIIASCQSRKAFWLKLIPAVITVLSAFKLVADLQGGASAPNWAAWVTLVSGLVTLFNVFMEPEKTAKAHLFAAKAFTVLKHDARSLYEAFRHYMDEKEFFHAVKALREKYNWLVQCTPPTNGKKAWSKARENIKQGIHQADFRPT